jgi:DNA-binding beta-propeller fold protein YncE
MKLTRWLALFLVLLPRIVAFAQSTADCDTTTAGSTLMVTNSAASHVSFVDPTKGDMTRLEVGASPWGIALAPDHLAYISMAEGVAVIDTCERKLLNTIPYQARIDRIQYGEYRPGGMGVAASPDGKRVYVGIYLPDHSQLEIIDTQKLEVIGTVKIGIRPFDVVTSPTGDQVYSIDHDSYSITIIDAKSFESRVVDVRPLGNGSFDKPHYAAVGKDGRLWLPYQGRVMITLDPQGREVLSTTLTANTHQHGIAFTPDERYLLIIGTGAAGGATQGPSLTIFDVQKSTETVIPLTHPHEKVAISADGHYAYLTGGYLLPGGWDGLTIYDLQQQTLTELSIPDLPLDIKVLP